VLLVKPQTYMNRSGVAVAALWHRLEFDAEDALIVSDDFLLDFGRLRFRRKGSDGGHNGLASVIEEMGTQRIPRLRVGISSPLPERDVIDYVLSPFAADEDVEQLVERTCEAVEVYLSEGMDAAMNLFNR
jgi:PTH1 family peptidyl-tRNA hydrolase